MAYGISQPVTHDSECTQYYKVEIKKDTDTQYTTLQNQLTSPIVVEGLLESTNYNLRITRVCCNGQMSNIAVRDFTTGA